MALITAQPSMHRYLLHGLLLIQWAYADTAIDDVFDVILHGNMLHRSTDERGRADDGTLTES